MSNEINPERAVSYIMETAPKYAKAKAARVKLEEFRKSKKAALMNSSTETVLGKQESYAYAHPEYLEVLNGLEWAVEEEEKYKWMMIAAQAKIEIWKTLQYNSRAEMKAFA